MIVLSAASDQFLRSTGSQDLHLSTEIARLFGFCVYSISIDDGQAEPTTLAFSHIPAQERETPGIYLGTLPGGDRYETIYRAALHKGIRLLNTPDEHQMIQEFDRAYGHLQDLTPPSRIITTVAQCADVVADLGLPVFVRGAVQSRKQWGWKACVAETFSELEHLTQTLLDLPDYSRGRVMVRQLIQLRHDRVTAHGFPQGREFRIILYRGNLITYGYNWQGDDPLRYITSVEEEAGMLGVAFAAAARLNVPYVAIDVGQQIDGSWIVMETGDPQFSGTGQIPLIQFWQEMRAIACTD